MRELRNPPLRGSGVTPGAGLTRAGLSGGYRAARREDGGLVFPWTEPKP